MENAKVIVYHYCSAEIFQKIIETRTLRLADITKSNDTAEILWITQFIDDAIEQEYQRQEKAFRDKCSLDSVIMRKAKYYQASYWGEFSRYAHFVSCFTGKGDSIGQWCRYADDEKGFAIGFSSECFEQFTLPENQSDIFYRYGCVEYNEKEQRNLVNDSVKSMFKQLNEVLIQEKHEGYINGAIGRQLSELFRTAAFCKNSFFSEEEEYRAYIRWDTKDPCSKNIKIVCKTNQKIVASLKYTHYTKKGTLCPCIDATFEAHFPIVKVMIGPKNVCSEGEIQNYLREYGIKCDVSRSKGTYI